GMTGRVGSTRRRGLKGASPSCQLPPSSNNKTAAQQRPDPFQPSRLNPRQARGPGGEEHVAPALQSYTVAASRSSESKSSRDFVDWSPPCRRTPIASSDSLSPQTSTYGIFSTSALRIRLPTVSSESSISTRNSA